MELEIIPKLGIKSKNTPHINGSKKINYKNTKLKKQVNVLSN